MLGRDNSEFLVILVLNFVIPTAAAVPITVDITDALIART